MHCLCLSLHLLFSLLCLADPVLGSRIPESSKVHTCPWVLLQGSNIQSPCVCQLLCGAIAVDQSDADLPSRGGAHSKGDLRPGHTDNHVIPH